MWQNWSGLDTHIVDFSTILTRSIIVMLWNFFQVWSPEGGGLRKAELRTRGRAPSSDRGRICWPSGRLVQGIALFLCDDACNHIWFIGLPHCFWKNAEEWLQFRGFGWGASEVVWCSLYQKLGNSWKWRICLAMSII